MDIPAELKIVDTLVGAGKEACKGALLKVHYDGFLENGTKFDSSVDRNRLFEFVLGTGRVIKGWDQGVMGMRVGGKRTLEVPAHLGYGDRAIGSIPPNSNLKFNIELFEVLTRDE